MPAAKHTTPRRDNRLGSYLKSRRLSFAQTARICGLKDSTVYRVVKGDREPGVTTFRQLSRGLNLPMETLYGLMYTD